MSEFLPSKSHFRFFLPPSKIKGGYPIITGQQAWHIHKVLRIKKGDKIVIFNGEGKEYIVEVIASSPFQVKTQIIESYTRDVESPLMIVLAQAVPKLPKMDLIVQKATEIGIAEIIPLITERTPASYDHIEKRMERWNHIIIESTQQSGRSRIMKLHKPLVFDELISFSKAEIGLRLICFEKAKGKLKEMLSSQNQHQKAIIAIGPEGSFTEQEINQAVQNGFVPVNLGPRTLRTETAGIVIASILQFYFGDLG